MDLGSTATAVATIITATGVAVAAFYNGRTKTLQEKNDIEVKDLKASNEYLREQITQIRDISKEVNESYKTIIVRVEKLEEENKHLNEENILLKKENAGLRKRVNTLEREYKASK